MQAQLVGSIWSNVLQQYPQHDKYEKTMCLQRVSELRRHGIYKGLFLI